MVGDRVVIKTWEQMETEYGVDKFGAIKCKKIFVERMRNLCGKKATIKGKEGKMICLTFDDINVDDHWSFSTDMIELAYPTVRGNDKENKKVEKKEVEKCKFKVGDIVIGSDKNPYRYEKGEKYRVVKIEPEYTNDIGLERLDKKCSKIVWSESKYFDLFTEDYNKVIYTNNTVEYHGKKATCQSGDRFDLEKGIMLCLLKEKGIVYRQIQELAKNAEKKIGHKFNVGDVVRVVDNGKRFSMYCSWFDEQKIPELKEKFCRKYLPNGRKLRIVHLGEHSLDKDKMIYACEDLKGEIYLIGEKGLKKVED